MNLNKLKYSIAISTLKSRNRKVISTDTGKAFPKVHISSWESSEEQETEWIAPLKLWGFTFDFTLIGSNIFLCTYSSPKSRNSMTELELEQWVSHPHAWLKCHSLHPGLPHPYISLYIVSASYTAEILWDLQTLGLVKFCMWYFSFASSS